MYYYPLQPPYFLLFVGLFMAITSGFALSGTLQSIVQKWQKNNPENPLTNAAFRKRLSVPFLGITAGVCLFMASGLEIFGFPSFLALGVGLPLSILTCLLVWLQLGSMLTFAQRQGLRSLDLDSLP
ncbi:MULTISPECIES: hypothetical protein [unclassified Anabaena]|uniref:hypothetical protein n=1 Tax=unclassified Anabaena TaxID=2619674 RepID=UPI00082CF96B|nr:MULTISPECIES: hypothetical protein [unclassified Anabaena]